MANKNTKPEGTPAANAAELLPIEQLRDKHKVGRATFAGVCAAKDWRPGRATTETEFLAAVTEFNDTPMNGATRKESEAKK